MGGLIPTVPGIAAAGGGGPTTLLDDDFEGAGSDTALDSWTPTTGGWTEDANSTSFATLNVTTAGDLVPSGTDFNDRIGYNSTTAPTSADQRITAVVDNWSGFDADRSMQLRLRVTSGGGSYCLSFVLVGANAFYRLEYHSNSTTATTLDSYTDTDEAGGDEIVYSVEGTSLSVLINGVEQLSATDSNISAAGNMGVGMGWGNANRDVFTATADLESILFEEL